MRLITNISFVQMEVNGGPLRLSCRALVLDESEPLFKTDPLNQRVLGYGSDTSWSVFTRWLDCGHLEYEMADAAGNHAFMVSDAHPEGRPLFSGATMKFSDGTEFYLQAEDQERPLDISDYDDNEELRAELSSRVRRYYRAPYFPKLAYVPIAAA